jgi:hypothetical protein
MEAKRLLEKIPLHPFLLALYFVLSLLGLNISQMYAQESIRAVLMVIILAGALLLVMRLVYKDWQRAALATSLCLVLFFTYGHVYNFLETNLPTLGRHRLLLPLWLVLVGLGLWWIARRVKNPRPITRAVNIVALVALVFPIFQIASWEVRQAMAEGNAVVEVPGIGNLELAEGESPPDVYFIVLDMYAREDLLKELYDYDNSAFLDELRQLGFQVIECSQSNYSQTEMVLASTFNMNYLDALGQFDTSTKDSSILRQWVKDNLVMQAFRSLGYKLVSFETGFHFSEFFYADHYLSPKRGNQNQVGRMNNFEVMLLKSTIGLALSDFAQILPSFLVPDTSQPLETKRELIRYDFEKLKTIPEDITGPKFVFAHILTTHEPFVFSADGSAMNYPESMEVEQYNEAYRNQVEYTNRQLIPILKHIIADSDPKPIIILQGDTGPGLASNEGRMANLSAYYLPGYAEILPPTITPVNNFRLVFGQYFGADLDLLADRSNFSRYTSPFDMELITNHCVPNQ